MQSIKRTENTVHVQQEKCPGLDKKISMAYICSTTLQIWCTNILGHVRENEPKQLELQCNETNVQQDDQRLPKPTDQSPTQQNR